MILNRPANLILAAFTALFNVVLLALAGAGVPINGELTAAVNLAAAAVITLIAGTPPLLNPGDSYHVKTGNGDPTIQRVVTRGAPQIRHDDPPDPAVVEPDLIDPTAAARGGPHDADGLG